MTAKAKHLVKAIREYDKELSYLVNTHLSETSELSVVSFHDRIAEIRNATAAKHGLSELSLDRAWELWSRFKSSVPVRQGRSFSFSVTPSGHTIRVFHLKDGEPTSLGEIPFNDEAMNVLRAMAEIYEKDNL
jgi:hypothetical protein